MRALAPSLPAARRRKIVRPLLARAATAWLILAALLLAPHLVAQELPRSALDWSGGVSDVPLIDLTGSWEFVPDRSDPMVEEWQGRKIVYQIQQHPDRILLDFRPDGGLRNTQGYRWDGTVAEFERGGAEVRERARWIDGGRTLEIEGRWWTPEEPEEINAYTFRYSLRSPDDLLFVQANESGSTTWRFRRS